MSQTGEYCENCGKSGPATSMIILTGDGRSEETPRLCVACRAAQYPLPQWNNSAFQTAPKATVQITADTSAVAAALEDIKRLLPSPRFNGLAAGGGLASQTCMGTLPSSGIGGLVFFPSAADTAGYYPSAVHVRPSRYYRLDDLIAADRFIGDLDDDGGEVFTADDGYFEDDDDDDEWDDDADDGEDEDDSWA